MSNGETTFLLSSATTEPMKVEVKVNFIHFLEPVQKKTLLIIQTVACSGLVHLINIGVGCAVFELALLATL